MLFTFGIGVAVLIALVGILHGTAPAPEQATRVDSREPVELVRPPAEGGPRDLLVLVHGFTLGPDSLDGLTATVPSLGEIRTGATRSAPGLDLLRTSYPSSTFSNADPYRIAHNLERIIDKADRERNYRDIYLIGHSLGALIVRKAFVWGHGAGADRPGVGAGQATAPWAKKVRRIVLLAGINRGWSIDPAPRNMRWPTWLLWQAGILWSDLSARGHLIRSIERGEPFVADLRVQWIRLSRRLGASAPAVVQLIGDHDDIIDTDHDRDISVTQFFHCIPVAQTGHASVVDFEEPVVGEERRDAWLDALTLAPDELRERYERCAVYPRVAGRTHVVFVMHGIRDEGDWTLRLKRMLEDADPDLVAITSQYGYFPMARFLLLGDRQKNVRWFMDQYTEAFAKYPDAKTWSFVGHSNGTYILASALERYRELRVDRVAFAGSVVPKRFAWSDFAPDRVDTVRNYVADSDCVVAIFPRFFELLHELFGWREKGGVGSAGFSGFDDQFVHDQEVRYVSGGHSTVVSEEGHLKSIVDFIVAGAEAPPGEIAERNALILWLSKLTWLVWPALAIILLGIGYAIVWVVRRHTRFSPGWTRAGYLLVVVLSLYTV